MKVWRTVLFILIVIFTYIELENLMPYDTARIFMNILLGLVVFTNGIDCYKNGQRKMQLFSPYLEFHSLQL